VRVQVRDIVRVQTRGFVRVHGALFLSLFGLSLIALSTQAQADPITVSPVPVSTEIQLNGLNDPLIIDIQITNPDPQAIKSWSLDLYFDPVVFDPLYGIGTVSEQGFELGDYIPDVIGMWNPNYESNGVSPDVARMGALNIGTGVGSDPTGLLARVALDVLSLSPGSTLWLQGQLILAGGGGEAPDVIFESTQVIVTENPPPTMTAAESIKEHGIAGEFAIDVLATGPIGLECRSAGTTKIVVTFDKNIQRINGDLSDVSLSSGTVLSINVVNDQLAVTMSDTTDAALLLATFPGIADANDVSAIVTDTLCIRQLVGGIVGNGEVNPIDMSAVQDHMDETANVANFRSDLNSDGLINLFDMLNIRDHMDNTLTGTCP